MSERTAGRRVVVVGAGSSLAGHLATRGSAAPADILSLSPPPSDGLRCDALWLVLHGDERSAAEDRRAEEAAAHTWLEALPRLGAREINLVNAAGGAAGGGDRTVRHRALAREVEERCRALGIGYRVFCVSLVLGTLDSPAHEHEGLCHVLAVLHALKSEIEDRLPEYFDYQALRCWAPADARLNVVRAEDAAELMLRIARRTDTLGREFDIAARREIPLGELWERIGLAYGLTLLTTADRTGMNAVDRLFELRLAGFEDHVASRSVFAPEPAYLAGDFAPDEGWLDDAGEVFSRLRARQDVALHAARERAASLLGSLPRRTIGAGDTSLTYLTAGAGDPPVVILNALAHGLAYWTRLVPHLAERRRVILWEPRSTAGAPAPLSIRDQVRDIEAVLAAEGVPRCHVAGWCTGPKVAVELYLHRPGTVVSMALLNATFKCTGGPADVDSPYEQSFEPILRTLERRRTLAATLATTLRSLSTRSQDDARAVLEDGDPEQLAERALTGVNRDLQPHVVAPFESEASTLRYLDQVVDFWSYDTRVRAAEVRVPVLFLTAERDTVASPSGSRSVARLFPDARCVEVRGATHYCLYDRPALVSELLDSFFADPMRLRGLGQDVELVA